MTKREPLAADEPAKDAATHLDGLRAWVNASGQGVEEHLDEYFEGVARARYVVRRIFRIFDEQAGRVGLEPLQHQALIQVLGAGREAGLPVNSLAERLDIPPAFASRMVQELQARGLVARRRSEVDRRVTLVTSTPAGREILARISRDVHAHVAYFQSQLSPEDRNAALAIFAFYVGVPLDKRAVTALEVLIDSATTARQ